MVNDHFEVMLAENNEQGEPCGRVTNIEFQINGETALSLETPDMEGDRIETNDRIIHIYDNTVKHSGRAYWAGNRMWNRYNVPYNYGLGMLMLLQNSKRWRITEGWEELFEKWEKGTELKMSDFVIDDDSTPMVVQANQLNIPWQRKNMVDIKVYEAAELYEIPIKPLTEWIRNHLLGGDHGGPEVPIQSWKPGYYSIPMMDDDVAMLYEFQSSHQSTLKIIGVEPIDS